MEWAGSVSSSCSYRITERRERDKSTCVLQKSDGKAVEVNWANAKHFHYLDSDFYHYDCCEVSVSSNASASSWKYIMDTQEWPVPLQGRHNSSPPMHSRLSRLSHFPWSIVTQISKKWWWKERERVREDWLRWTLHACRVTFILIDFCKRLEKKKLPSEIPARRK